MSTDEVFRLLVLCTANQCRSPMAEVMAQEILDDRGVPAEVVSAGLLPGGVMASSGSRRAMRRRGLDLEHHVSHTVDADTVAAADLILTMERRHLASVAELDLSAIERSFTLKELAELTTVVGPRSETASIAEWITAAHRMRIPTTVLSMSEDADVDDPMGGPSRLYRKAAEEIDRLLHRVIESMFP